MTPLRWAASSIIRAGDSGDHLVDLGPAHLMGEGPVVRVCHPDQATITQLCIAPSHDCDGRPSAVVGSCIRLTARVRADILKRQGSKIGHTFVGRVGCEVMFGQADQGWTSIDWSSLGHDADVRGRRVRFVDIGTGPEVVLVHGLGGCWQWWLRVLPVLAKHARVIAIDLPGFGESDPVLDGSDVFGEHVATVLDLIEHLELTRPALVGHSMGGLVALQAACDRPDLVSGLALVDAGGANIGPRRLRALLASFRAFDAVFAHPWIPVAIARRPRLRAAMFAVAVHDSRTFSGPLAMQIIPRMAAPGFVAAVESAGAAVNRATPQDVRCPTLVLWGAHDRILPLKTGHALASRISDARMVSMDRVGHCPMVEAPVRLGSLLAEFVRDPEHGRPPDQAREVSRTARNRPGHPRIR